MQASETGDEPIDKLEDVLERLEGKRVVKFAFAQNAKFAAKFQQKTQEQAPNTVSIEGVPTISPD